MSEQPVIGGLYRLGEPIGQGGMGTVYHGTDIHTQLPVAIKELKPEITRTNGDAVQRFLREAEALRKLNHPSIVKVLGSYQEADRHYIVMEYISGGSLDEAIQETPQMPIERVLDIALDLSDALTRAHRLKIIHRDIKPANVLIREDGSPLLTDFGVARIGNTTRMTAADSIVGTLAYLSPEALRSETVDERLDIWAFGVLLYEMLVGQHPFAAETTGAVVHNIISMPVVDILSQRSDVPVLLAGLVYWMLEKEPKDRPSSVRLVGAALEKIIATLAQHQDESIPVSPTLSQDEILEAVRQLTKVDSKLDAASTPQPIPLSDAEKTVLLNATSSANSLPLKKQPPSRKLLTSVMIAVVVGIIALGLIVMLSGQSGSSSITATQVSVAPVGENERMVLIAQFENISGAERDVAANIQENLQRNLIDSTPYAKIALRTIPTVFRNADEARQFAETVRADVVIWGSYDTDGVTAYVHIGNVENYPTLEMSRDDLATLTNIRVLIANERRETLAYGVIAILNALAAWSGDTFTVGRNLLALEAIDESAATGSGNGIDARHYRYIVNYINDPEISIQEITEALRLDANNPALYAVRALAYLRANNIEKSRVDTRTAERLYGANGASWFPILMLDATDTFFFQQNYAEAYTYISQLVEKRPFDFYILSLRGINSYFLEDYAAAEADFEQAIDSNPQVSFPYVFAVATALRRGDIARAKELFDIILEEFPDPSFTENILRVTLNTDATEGMMTPMVSAFGSVTLRRWQDVLTDTQRLADSDVQFADAYLLRGLAACNLDQNDQAEEEYSRAIEIDPSYSLIYLLRAQIRQQTGNLLGAASDLSTALSRPELAALMEIITKNPDLTINCKTFLDVDLSEVMNSESTETP